MNRLRNSRLRYCRLSLYCNLSQHLLYWFEITASQQLRESENRRLELTNSPEVRRKTSFNSQLRSEISAPVMKVAERVRLPKMERSVTGSEIATLGVNNFIKSLMNAKVSSLDYMIVFHFLVSGFSYRSCWAFGVWGTGRV